MAKRKGKKKGGRANLPSLSATLAIAGGVTLLSATAASAAAAAMDKFSPMLALLGISSGVGLVGAAVALKGASSLFPSFGRKYRGFLRGYGFRP